MNLNISKQARLSSIILGLFISVGSAQAQSDDHGWHHKVHSFGQSGWLSVDYMLGGPYDNSVMHHVWMNVGGAELRSNDVLDAQFNCEWRNAVGRSGEPSTYPVALLFDGRSQKFTALVREELPIVWEGRTGARAERLCSIQLFVNGNEVLATDFQRFNR